MSKRNPYDYQRQILRKILTNIRKNKNIKQIELAKSLNKPQSFISKYENGERNLDLIEINQLCKVLKFPLIKVIKEFEVLSNK
ncbi:COG1396: Predicted transcriptional regulators [hydrothermal vent metagenome]|uniref:COG1396: Predicted transcriptional regulators n=1 Tax=hydrothermal vent metagenome TaxID=652676 RepID=A0A1W1CNQ9_9ZZZZ